MNHLRLPQTLRDALPLFVNQVFHRYRPKTDSAEDFEVFATTFKLLLPDLMKTATVHSDFSAANEIGRCFIELS